MIVLPSLELLIIVINSAKAANRYCRPIVKY